MKVKRSTHPNMFSSKCFRGDRTGQPWRIGVVALTKMLSHISGCCCQYRQHAASGLPPTTAPTNTSPHCLEGAGGLVAAVSCRMFIGQNYSWGVCFPLDLIQQVVAHLSSLFDAEQRKVENGVLRQGWGSLFSQQHHLGQLSEPVLNIADAGPMAWQQCVDVYNLWMWAGAI